MSFKMNETLRSVARASVARGIVAISGLLLTITLPLVLSLDQVGKFYLILTYSTFLSILMRMGLDYDVNGKIASVSGEARIIKFNYLVSLLTTSSLVAVFSLFVFYLITESDLFNIKASEFGYLIVSLGFSLAVSAFLFQLYRIDGHVFRASLVRGLSINGSFLISLIILSNVGELDEESTLCVMVIFTLIVSLINIFLYFYFYIGAFPIRRIGDRRDRNSSNLPFLFYSLLAFFIADVDYWVVAAHLDDENLAIYATMKRVALLAAIFLDIGNLVAPKILRNTMQNIKKECKNLLHIRRLAFLFSLLSFTAAIFVFMFGEFLIGKIWGERFTTGFYPLVIFMVAYGLILATGFSEALLILKSNRRVMLQSMTIAFVSIVFLSNYLTAHFELIGASLSFLICAVGLRAYWSYKVFKMYNYGVYASWK